MKVLTYILALTVIFLSVKPVIDALPFSSDNQQTCCSSSKCSPVSNKQNSDNNSDNEANGMCNPFQVCGSCSLVITKVQYASIAVKEFRAPIYSHYTFSYSSSFISDFWQPPKFV